MQNVNKCSLAIYFWMCLSHCTLNVYRFRSCWVLIKCSSNKITVFFLSWGLMFEPARVMNGFCSKKLSREKKHYGFTWFFFSFLISFLYIRLIRNYSWLFVLFSFVLTTCNVKNKKELLIDARFENIKWN
jgi:hypothetical protein